MFKTNDKNERITVRLNDKQKEFIDKMSSNFICSRSDVVRMMLNFAIAKYDKFYTEGANEDEHE